MEAAEKAGERVSTAEFDVAIGPMKEAHFFSHVWAYGRHFRIMGRDLDKKTTMGSGISCIYSDSKGIGKEFVGYVEHIIRIFFSPTISSVVIKGKWWDSIVRQRGPNGTLVVDECGFFRVKAGPFMPDGSIVDEPLAFPKDLNQVFLVDDIINVGWKLFVNVNPRSVRCTYQREANNSNEDEAVEFTAQSAPGPTSARRGGCLVSIVSDDNAGEDLDFDHEADEDFLASSSDDEEEDARTSIQGESVQGETDILPVEEDEDEFPRHIYVGQNFSELREDELADLASDGELDSAQSEEEGC
jgi:hypothetical protein